MWKSVVSLSAVVLLATTARAQVNAADVKWGPAPAIFPKGAQMAVLAGDPTKAGVFVIRLKTPAAYRIPAHHHPSDEYVTVISGDFHLGMGDKLDEARSAALSAGGFALAPAGMNHFAWTTSGAVVEVHAQGPFEMIYANPADDLTKP